jgi:hypothetical protein
MQKKVSLLMVLVFTVIPALLFSQRAGTRPAANNGVSAIREQDLRTDLFEMASDHFKGREAGTLDELNASMWLADKARAAGLKPAGDNGTYFQFFTMWRNRIAPGSDIRISDRSFQLWKDVLVSQIAPGTVDAPIVFSDGSRRDDWSKADVRGKAVALLVSPEGINLNIS